MRLWILAAVLILATACASSQQEEEASSETTTEEETTAEETTVQESTTAQAVVEETVRETVVQSAPSENPSPPSAPNSTAKGPCGISTDWQQGQVDWMNSTDEQKAAIRECHIAQREAGTGPTVTHETAEQAAEDWRTPSQKMGMTEGGQDVSNTPVLSPAERADRGSCLKAYYDSLPPEERGPESQRVTAEANALGVSPFDIVGC